MGKQNGKKNRKKRYRKALLWVFALALGFSITAGYGRVSDGMSKALAAGSTPVSAHGKLSVSGTTLTDQYGKPFQIRGVSTHGLQWFSQYNNKDAYATLRDDWGANCIRLAMYTDENGYCTGNQAMMKDEVTKGVQYATELGMYAIIDWHILHDGNPQTYKAQAIGFFAEMADRYKDYDNVIYEICNEPNGCSWQDIKSYAVEVIAAIRARDADAIIIVGTPMYSQLGSAGHLYEPVDDPITGYDNLMYSFHFYASEPAHNQWLTEKIGTAINRGLPVFVSEFGLSEASGDGNVDIGKAEEWLNRCDQYQVSYCAWSLSNDHRSSSLIRNSSGSLSGWTTDELTTAGNFVRDWYRKKAGAETVVDDSVNNPEVKNLAEGITVSYQCHVQSYGWQDWVSNGKMSGTSGRSKRLEGICIQVAGGTLGIRYRTHIQSYGWQDWRGDGKVSGTEGESKRLEAICIELTGADKDKYDVYYRVHAQSYGWLDWAKNGAAAGTEGFAKRLEGINIAIVPKGADPGVPVGRPFVSLYPGIVNYRTHVQTHGWQSWGADGGFSGTEGESKRLEGIEMRLAWEIPGRIQYQTHVQSYGWQDWVADGKMSGTEGESKRLEGIRIRLTGEAENQYDIYYQVHAQTYGWLDWAKNGEMAGTSGLSKRLEGIRIQLVPKGGAAPGNTARPSIEG
ncbi:MAG: cellulase family glycosylhydrolase [Lachnospiraceae bacterium]|nr:cellulase family glycosylhydrolase [Lachnospiraceae bacterium]